MRILLFALEYPPWRGGVANYYGNLVKHWPEPKSIFVLDNNQGKLIKQSWPILKWLPAFRELDRCVKKNKIEQIIVGQILPLGWVAFIYGRFYKIRYSVFLHGLDFSLAAKIWRKKLISKLILNRAEKIICGNSFTAGQVKKFLLATDENKILAVNPGVDNQASRDSHLATQLKEKYNLHDKIILLSVGRLIKRKGFDKVIEAMPDLLKKMPNLIYIIIGDGPENANWKLKIGKLALMDRVKIINRVPDDERDQWYNVSDIFIMPTRNILGDYEGFGIVYLEANLAGKPVIASASGGVYDAVIDGYNGLLVDPEDISKISRAVIRLALDPELRDQLGRQGRERAINEFNWEGQVRKIYLSITK